MSKIYCKNCGEETDETEQIGGSCFRCHNAIQENLTKHNPEWFDSQESEKR